MVLSIIHIWCILHIIAEAWIYSSFFLPKSFWEESNYKTDVIDDPLGQTHSFASSEHRFRLKFV